MLFFSLGVVGHDFQLHSELNSARRSSELYSEKEDRLKEHTRSLPDRPLLLDDTKDAKTLELLTLLCLWLH